MQYSEKQLALAPVKDIHRPSMPLIWIVIVNLLIILATYSSSRTAILIHSIGGFVIVAFTISIDFMLILGIFDSLDPSDSTFYFHAFFGSFFMCVMLLQAITGILTRLSNILGSGSYNILNLKHFHMITGIITVIFGKIQVYVMLAPEKSTFYIIFDIISLAFYLYRKVITNKLTYTALENQKDQLLSVKDLKSFEKERKNVVIYGNKIYDLENMTMWHPGGFQILQTVKGTQIQKYLLGIYSPIKLQKIGRHSHSNLAIQLLDAPIAKLAIPSNYKGLNAENTVSVIELRKMDHETWVYELHLKTGGQLECEGYKDIKQLGRFYCLTLNNKITRLYTQENFLNWKNVMLLKQYLKSEALERYYSSRQCHTQSIPLLFRHYIDGQFTHELVNDRNPQLTLSQEQGVGLKFDEVEPGQIVIIAGGTGVHPFLDLCDLLYKRHLIEKNPNLLKVFAQDNPLISSDIFSKFTFRIFAAFQNISDIHPITLQQWIELTTSARFSLFLNIFSRVDKDKYRPLKFIEDNFETVVAHLGKQSHKISKIYVCGPPKMNEGLYNILRENFDHNRFTIL